MSNMILTCLIPLGHPQTLVRSNHNKIRV